MEVRLRGWRCRNLRGGLRDLYVDLGARPARWTLVQMPNGTGKTTTMKLLIAVLTQRDWTVEEVQALQPTRAEPLGSFEAQLLIDDDPFSLEVAFDFETGTAAYTTTRVKAEGGGKEPGIHLPGPLQVMLSPEFARFIVFDGELAREIRDVRRSEASLAISGLYRLELLDSMAETARRYAEAAKKKILASQAETQKGLRRRQTMLEEVEAALSKLLIRRDDLKKERERLTSEQAQLDATINTRVSTIAGRGRLLEERRTREREAVNEIRAGSQGLLETLRTPAAVHARILDRLKALGGKLETLKLPQTMSQEFFLELAEEKVCVCGRSIGPAEHDAIIERAPQYLAENQIAIINAMKSAVRSATADPEHTLQLADDINSADRRRRQAAEAIQALLDSVEAEGDQAIAEAREKRLRLGHRLEEIEKDLNLMEGPVPAGADTWKRNIRAATEERNQRKRALEDATDTRRLALQTEWLCGVLGRIRGIAENKLTETIQQKTNQKLQRLIATESIEVSKIDGALVLSDGEGRRRSGVSEGQNLAVAYAFLSSLFEGAAYRLPFIVDSPAVSLDVRVRREVAAMVPELFHQMVMFVISSEREGFADGFYGREGTKFITVWRDESGEIRQSDDMGLFRSFHSDEEGDNDGAAR